jgi:transcriptional regulator with XRE-family HTH domain
MTNGTTTVTNEQIARDLNMSDSMVSRLRSGDRLPSFATMQVIASRYNWPIDQQARARNEGTYAKSFEYMVGLLYVE